MLYADKRPATEEAAKRTRLGWPHRVVPVLRHEDGCLVSDGACIPAHPCTCGRARVVGWSLQLGAA